MQSINFSQRFYCSRHHQNEVPPCPPWSRNGPRPCIPCFAFSFLTRDQIQNISKCGSFMKLQMFRHQEHIHLHLSQTSRFNVQYVHITCFRSATQHGKALICSQIVHIRDQSHQDAAEIRRRVLTLDTCAQNGHSELRNSLPGIRHQRSFLLVACTR